MKVTCWQRCFLRRGYLFGVLNVHARMMIYLSFLVLDCLSSFPGVALSQSATQFLAVIVAIRGFGEFFPLHPFYGSLSENHFCVSVLRGKIEHSLVNLSHIRALECGSFSLTMLGCCR